MQLIKGIRRFYTLVALLFAAAALAGCGGSKAPATQPAPAPQKQAMEKIKEAGTLRVGILKEVPPLSYTSQTGETLGYDVAIAGRIAADLLGPEGHLQLVPLDAPERIPALLEGRVDLLVANLTVTEERSKQIAFSKPYLEVSLGVLSRADLPVYSLAQLSGKKLIAVRGTTAESFFAARYPEVRLIKYNSDAEAFTALLAGHADAMAEDNLMLEAWAKQHPGFTVGIPALGETDKIAPAVRKEQAEFLQWLDMEIIKLVAEGFTAKAYERSISEFYGDLTPRSQAAPAEAQSMTP